MAVFAEDGPPLFITMAAFAGFKRKAKAGPEEIISEAVLRGLIAQSGGHFEE